MRSGFVSRNGGRSLGLIWVLLALPALAVGEAPTGPPKEASRPREQPSLFTELLEEVRGLRADVSALRDRPAPATAADVERLRGEVDRLAKAERDLAHALEERGATPPTDPPGEGGFPWLVLAIGIVVGWAGGRVAQGRRERRQRGKLWW